MFVSGCVSDYFFYWITTTRNGGSTFTFWQHHAAYFIHFKSTFLKTPAPLLRTFPHFWVKYSVFFPFRCRVYWNVVFHFPVFCPVLRIYWRRPETIRWDHKCVFRQSYPCWPCRVMQVYRTFLLTGLCIYVFINDLSQIIMMMVTNCTI